MARALNSTRRVFEIVNSVSKVSCACVYYERVAAHVLWRTIARSRLGCADDTRDFSKTQWSSWSPPPPALEAVQRLHGMPHPAEAAITFPHGRSDSVVNDVRVGGSSRTVHHPRRARGNWPEQTDLRIKRPHLREADDPSGIPRQSFIAIEQREGATGLDRLEASDERLFDLRRLLQPDELWRV